MAVAVALTINTATFQVLGANIALRVP